MQSLPMATKLPTTVTMKDTKYPRHEEKKKSAAAPMKNDDDRRAVLRSIVVDRQLWIKIQDIGSKDIAVVYVKNMLVCREKK